MNKKIKTGILLLLIILMIFLTFKQVVRVQNSFNRVKLPTAQSRQLSEAGIYNSMTVEQLSQKFNVPSEKIFNLLQISPDDDDYKLTIRELRKKYKKSPDEIYKALMEVVVRSKGGSANE
jgi:hypothetical protein